MNIKELKGVGDKKAALFERLSIYDTVDLLEFYPRDYEVYERPFLIKELKQSDTGRVIAIDGVVTKKPGIYRAGKYSVAAILIRDIEGRFLKCKWFNMPYIGKSLPLGSRYVFRGYLAVNKGGELSLDQAKFFRSDEYAELEGKMLPVYHLTKGLTQKAVRSAVEQAFDGEKEQKKDFMPAHIREKAGLTDLYSAIKNIHFPESMDKVKEAVKRLTFDEFFLFSMSVLLRKNDNVNLKTRFRSGEHPAISELKERLKFKLTDAQNKAWNDMIKDMESAAPMNRLLQGDVGSGKTIVAILALFNTVLNGYQAALMAPTEVLAIQEYNEIAGLIDEHGLDIRAGLLTGSVKAREKKELYEALEKGEIDIIVGTHAVIQEKVKFKDLGLVITDEQHRFGVGQRKALKDKSEDDNPNILVMSATPIPRTLAWILYGDLDISVMDQLPAGRKSIKNAVVDSSYRPNAYNFIRSKVAAGNQAYVICPMVESSEEIKIENVTDYAASLAKELGKDIKVGMLHGKLKAEEKRDIIDKFLKNEINVLVSTTVVEVGVNVPNATVMMIENAERFGLSQLHQLRGRVGRGREESYCLFVSDSGSEAAKKRLDIISGTNDGFIIAEKDLELRGPGDFFGARQSGDMEFSMADPGRDMKLLTQSVNMAKQLVKEDPDLELDVNRRLRKRLIDYQDKGIDKINL